MSSSRANPEITFSFGKNWIEYLATVDDEVITEAGKDIDDWLGTENIRDKSIVDIGSGSGLSSLCMHRRGCGRLVSFDYDPHSVEATKSLAEREGSPENWKIFEGSILDEALVNRLGTFDIVHSWGVLHHTGDMWKAIDNAIRLCNPDALFFISLYRAGDRYKEHLALKRRFNKADEETKAEMVRTTKSISPAYKSEHRGMSAYHDAIDWLGGLPYEVAHPSEVILFGAARGLRPLRVCETGQQGCSIYLFRNDRNPGVPVGEEFEWSRYRTNEKGQRTLQRQLGEDLETMRSELEFRRVQMESLTCSARHCLGIIRRRFFAKS